MITILKWFDSQHPQNSLLSKTCGKLSVIHRDYAGPRPKQGELWRCRLVSEVSNNLNRGMFLANPIEKVNHNDIQYLQPDEYTTKTVSKKLIVTPPAEGNWLMSLFEKQMLCAKHGAYALIVQLDA